MARLDAAISVPSVVMAGLDPAIFTGIAIGPAGRQARPMQGGWVYFMTNRRDGVLYVGVTSDLAKRAWEHREGIVEGFTSRYRLKRLVYAERHDDIRSAIQREKNLKHWPRAWKIELIEAQNPDWTDLCNSLL
ncbi:MAG TPA: GIY-YIG nuclease family protein [Stellaceae bacterium]|nr:GIY-YIG nuclease family protein [Stellaceae bacterium]